MATPAVAAISSAVTTSSPRPVAFRATAKSSESPAGEHGFPILIQRRDPLVPHDAERVSDGSNFSRGCPSRSSLTGKRAPSCVPMSVDFQNIRMIEGRNRSASGSKRHNRSASLTSVSGSTSIPTSRTSRTSRAITSPSRLRREETGFRRAKFREEVRAMRRSNYSLRSTFSRSNDSRRVSATRKLSRDAGFEESTRVVPGVLEE